MLLAEEDEGDAITLCEGRLENPREKFPWLVAEVFLL